MAKINKQSLWWQWILANALGELVGLGATFAIGVGLSSGLTDSPELAAALLSAGLMTATGALEGGGGRSCAVGSATPCLSRHQLA